MDKFELAKKVREASDEKGRLSPNDLANIVFHPDTPNEIVERFLKLGNKLSETENLWKQVGELAEKIQKEEEVLEGLKLDFDHKYDRLKQLSQELNMEKYLNLP